MLEAVLPMVHRWGTFEPFLLTCEVLFCVRCFQRRKGRLPLKIALCVGYVAIPTVIDGFRASFSFAPGDLNFGYLFMWTVSLGILWVSFTESWNRILFVGIISHIVQHLWQTTFILLCDLLCWELGSAAADLLGFLLEMGMMLLVYFVLARYFERHKQALADSVTLMIFSVFAQLIINFLYNYSNEVNGYANRGLYLYDIAISAVLLLLLYDVFSQRQLRSEAHTLERLIAQSEAKHRAAMENAESLDRKCHDLKHQIAALRLAPEDQREDYIRELEETVHTFERIYKTGNDTLDVLLAEKQPLCAQKDIALTVLADARGLCGMKALDIYTLFGNALDNAIEAAQQVPQSSGRVICLKVTRRGSLTCIDLENTCVRAPTFRDDLPLTTKGDTERHGYGVKSIRYLVEKYGGQMELSQSDGRFSLMIVFLLQEERS